MTGEARAPIRHVPPWTCVQKMARGDARRWATKAGAFAYVLACPACGRTGIHLTEEVGFVEEAMTVSTAQYGTVGAVARTYPHPELLTTTRPGPCPGCGGSLRAVGRELVTTPPSPTNG